MIDGDQLGRAFIAEAQRRMFDESHPRLVSCLDRLDDAQLWWRPNDAVNSVGNLLLHVTGNVRQWIVSGLGGAADRRRRAAEFAERGPIPAAELRRRLDEAMAAARAALEELPPEQLLEPRRVQGFDETPLSILVHVVEHLSYHTGQVSWIVKSLTGEDLGYYRGLDLDEVGPG